jgi:hypothetical protein
LPGFHGPSPFDLNAGGLAAAEAEPIIAQADFDGIAQGGHADHLDLLVFEQAHLHEPLDEGIVTVDGRDPAALTRTQLIQERHGSASHGTNEDLGALLAAKRQTAAADLQEARPAGLEHTQTAASPQTQLRQAADPTRLTRDKGHVRPFTRTQQFEREETFQIHGKHLWQSVGVSAILIETESQSKL